MSASLVVIRGFCRGADLLRPSGHGRRNRAQQVCAPTGQILRCWLGLCLGLVASRSAGAAENPAADLSPTTWHGEKALGSTSDGWTAIVSLERGRLVHFGPAGNELNLLFATPTRDDPAGWGGHRLWLGPQKDWAKIWPPPAAWEHGGAAGVTNEAGMLRLALADAGDGWPRLTRTYRWAGPKLVCGAELSGGTKPAQVIQIIQVPRTTVVDVEAKPGPDAPAGYVFLPSGSNPKFTADFSPPPHVTRAGDLLRLRHLGIILKSGFRPQTLTGRIGGFTLRVSRGPESGRAVASPDQGFFTQVYLGGQEPFIELEQLSPLFAPGTAAGSVIELEGVAGR